MYLNQKNFIYNVKDLSVILVKDSYLRLAERDKNIIQRNKTEE